MLIDLLSIYAILWILKTAVEDTAHAVKGTPNPRYELKRQKALAAGRAAPAQPRYGSRDWLADLASDALVAQTERRRAKAAKKKTPTPAGTDAGGEAGVARRPVDDMVDVAGVRAAKGAGDLPERPAFGVANSRPAETPGPKAGPGSGERPTAKPTSRPAPPVAQPTRSVPSAPPEASKVHSDAGPVVAQKVAAEPSRTTTPEPHSHSTTNPTRTPSAASTAGGQPLATVIPLFSTPKKENIMPTVDGEVTGLDPAISYAQALAHFAGEHGQAGNEGYISFLTQSKVAGAGLQSATDMQEAFANAQAAAERHADELAKQKTVQEAYDHNPDAGDKAFQQGGR